MTTININSNIIQNFINHRVYSGPINEDTAVEYEARRARRLTSVADNDVSISLILIKIDKMREAIKIILKMRGFQ